MDEQTFMKPIDGLTIKEQFNCLLVERGKRPAFYLSDSISYIKKFNKLDKDKTIKENFDVVKNEKGYEKAKLVKEHYPSLKVSRYYRMFIVHTKPLPDKENDSCYWTGKALGYDCPAGNIKILSKWENPYVVEYYLITDEEETQIYSEILEFKSQFKDKQKSFQEVAKKLNYKVESRIRKK